MTQRGAEGSRRVRRRACARSRAAGGSLSVVLLSFSSGLPLGVVWFAIPAWMAREGVDIKVIGLFTLAQAPVVLQAAVVAVDGPLSRPPSSGASGAGP